MVISCGGKAELRALLRKKGWQDLYCEKIQTKIENVLQFKNS